MNSEAQEFFYELMGSFTGAYPDPLKIGALIDRCYAAGLARGRLDTGNRAADLWNKLESDLGEMSGKVIGHVDMYADESVALPFNPAAPVPNAVTVRRVAQRELVIRWLDRSGNTPTLPALLTEAIEKAKAKKT
ncbi:hypothetical protein PQQ63_15305 [Paraburkholderia metrosideri]|uniref:Uncharacterized protein n=1 Tax=Paraburkholderia metrosideri TaxID=580937 RepID=A0ABW9DRT5_9BURK